MSTFTQKILMKELPHSIMTLFENTLIKELNQTTDMQVVEAGTVLIKPDEPTLCTPIVVSGSIKVLRLNEQTERSALLYYLREGDSCAVSFANILNGQNIAVQAITEETTSFLPIPKSLVIEWFSKYSSWRLFAYKTMLARFSNLLDSFDAVEFKRLDERVWGYLQHKSVLCRGHFLYITHEQIAQDLNVSREAITRSLKQLESMNLVVLARNKISLITAM